MEKNDRLQKKVSHFMYENGYFRQHTQNVALPSKYSSCESVVTSSQQHLTSQHLQEILVLQDSIGAVSIFHGCLGVAARARVLVGLEPTSVIEILKDRPAW
ncbi:homeobox-leucine zipper protein ATHB-15-like [Daucus carota subsp. sativus]|uniref:homeobox-leucine zipper protein ATHB-15-like n=1 Tax=Daucus carota subsp. sativus TaxID=79200 RepID=UPI0007EFD83E|nr:PREDICTED: homeobox-leucine zipper protein ATHB-15-like [Daucus carota subsp. sativus]